MWWMAPSLGCFNNTHLGTSDAVSERRPPHHRIRISTESPPNLTMQNSETLLELAFRQELANL
jgi:hypothetical protein